MYEQLRKHIVTGAKPLEAGDSVREGARRLSQDHLTDLPVVGADGRMIGLFGEKELITALSPSYLGGLSDTSFIATDFEDVTQQALEVMNDPVEAFMRREYATLGTDFSVLHCAELFLHQRQGVIPILDDGKPVGLLRRSDFGRAIIEGAADAGSPESAAQAASREAGMEGLGGDPT